MLPALAASVNGHWVHDLDPVLIPITETISVRYYGLAYAFGFLIAAWLFKIYRQAGRSRLPAEDIGDFMFAIVLGVMLGGRAGSFLLYELEYLPEILRNDPWRVLRVWEGGMASHGAFVGVILAIAWFARRRKIPFLHLGDLVVSTASAGILLGRIANFINGELWGRISTVSWAVIFPDSGRPGVPLEQIEPRHPSQLYEAGLEGALLLAWMQWRFWRSDVVARQPGRLAGEFLLGYALLRIAGEVFREPDASLILGLSRGMFYSLFLALAGAFLITRAILQPPAPPAPPSSS